MTLFSNQAEIFKSKTHLEANHQPDTFHGRDNEINELRKALYPVYKGERAKNIFIHGNAGTGKTSITKHVLSHLVTDAAEENITITNIYANCAGLTNTYQVTRTLVNKLRQHRHSSPDLLPKKGYSKPDMFEFLFDEIDNTNGTIIFVLDEIDALTDNDILYELPRAQANESIAPDTNQPGIIGISNSPDYLTDLPPSIRDTLNSTTIHFPPYTADELESILQARAEKAIYDDTYNQGIIRLTKALAAQHTNSVRDALRTLREAGEIARHQQATEITSQHVNEAAETIHQHLVEDIITSAGMHERAALIAVAFDAARDSTPARTAHLHHVYEQVIDLEGRDGVSHDRFRRRLDTLAESGILSKQTKHDNGQYSEYDLTKPLESILRALDNNLTSNDTLRGGVYNAVTTAEENNHLDTLDDFNVQNDAPKSP